jgi:iron complex outermembrane receptor protein
MSNYNAGVANQTDKNIMYSLYYKYFSQNLKIKIQSGGFYNQVLYEDPRYDPQLTNNRSFTSVNVSEFTYKLFNYLQLGFILEYKYEKGLSDYYNDWKTRNIVSPVLSLLYKSSRIVSVVNIRKENVNGNFIPFVFSAGFDLLIVNGLFVKGHVSKNYTLPTFNNLFWEFDGFAAGNKDLLPENGWSFETGMHYELKNDRLNFKSEIVLFQNNITNWIQWLENGNNIFQPQNIMEGLTRGIELNASINKKINSFVFQLNALYGFTHAVALKSGTENIQVGEQMFFIPKHKASLGLAINYKNYLAEYSQNFVGDRTYDNVGGTLDAYTLGNLTQQFTFKINEQIKFVVYMKMNNLWNTKYQMHKSYAQALRQYTIGIKFLFN